MTNKEATQAFYDDKPVVFRGTVYPYISEIGVKRREDGSKYPYVLLEDIPTNGQTTYQVHPRQISLADPEESEKTA